MSGFFSVSIYYGTGIFFVDVCGGGVVFFKTGIKQNVYLFLE